MSMVILGMLEENFRKKVEFKYLTILFMGGKR